MFQQLVRVLAAEMALHKHNKVNRQGIVSPHAQRFFVLKNILPEGVFRGLQKCSKSPKGELSARGQQLAQGPSHRRP